MTDLPETQPNDCPLELEQELPYKIVDLQLTEFYWGSDLTIPSEVLTVNDEAFNDIMRDAYAEISRIMLASTQARLADYLNLNLNGRSMLPHRNDPV